MKRKQTSDKVKEMADDTGLVLMNEEVHAQKSGTEGMMWGWLFIFFGILLLLNTFGIVPWNIWHTFVRFWPVLIIIAGVQIILGGSRIAKTIVGMIIFVLLGWVFLISLNETSPVLIQ